MGNPISNFISKFAKTPKRSIGKREIGSTGTKIFSGIIDEEFNPNLRSLEAVKVYDRMRKSDAQVFSSLQAVKLPLLSATWYIEPAKGDDINETEAQDQADFITKNLFKDLKCAMEDIKLDDISDSVELKDYIIQEMEDWKIGKYFLKIKEIIFYYYELKFLENKSCVIDYQNIFFKYPTDKRGNFHEIDYFSFMNNPDFDIDKIIEDVRTLSLCFSSAKTIFR